MTDKLPPRPVLQAASRKPQAASRKPADDVNPGAMMKAMGIALVMAVAGATAHAAGDLTRQEPIRVTMVLGNAKGEHRFNPDMLTLETGKLYVLRLENPSTQAYYFGSQGLADAIYSRKVVVLGTDAKELAEVYGPVRRMELKPGSTVEWWFLPVRTGRFEDVMSTRTHSEAGMRATIEVK